MNTDAYLAMKVLHLLGVMMVFVGFGALLARGMMASDHVGTRKLGGLTSGIGLLLIFIGGFGMLGMGKLGYPLWVIIKLVIWLVFGGLTAVANRKPQLSNGLWWGILVLGIGASIAAVFKPL